MSSYIVGLLVGLLVGLYEYMHVHMYPTSTRIPDTMSSTRTRTWVELYPVPKYDRRAREGKILSSLCLESLSLSLSLETDYMHMYDGWLVKSTLA